MQAEVLSPELLRPGSGDRHCSYDQHLSHPGSTRVQEVTR